MTRFATLQSLRAACESLPAGDDAAEAAVRARQATLTKPPGSLGRLEDAAAWLARWQGREMPQLDRVAILVFAGNHGVVARGVSPYPAEVTRQMVANFAAGGAAINQLARVAGAELRVTALALEHPTGDIATEPALEMQGFLEAVSTGFEAVAPGLGPAVPRRDGDRQHHRRGGAGGGAVRRRRRRVLGRARHRASTMPGSPASATRSTPRSPAMPACSGDALGVAAALGGRELAAIFGAVLAARLQKVPVLLDGFVCTAAAAPLGVLHPGGLAHAWLGHLSAEAGHRALAERLGLVPLLDLGLRLGEGSGAAAAVPLLRAAVACHTGMATFAEAGVADRD